MSVLRLVLHGLLSAAPPESACSIQWVGRVVESDTDEAIPDAQVVVEHSDGSAAVYARTTIDGTVALDQLCPGTLHVMVGKTEHESVDLSVALEAPLTESTIELDALHDHHSPHVIVVHDENSSSSSASDSLTGSELAGTRGRGLADALSGVSGVSTLRGSAGGMGKPIIRGHFGRRNLIVVDGVRHEGQDWGIDHAPEVDPNSAARITVIKGASTTRFGPEAIGGVILLEPRPLLRSPGLAGEVGTFGYSNPLGGGASARLDYAPRSLRGLGMRVEGNVGRHRAALTPTHALDNTGAWTWNTGARLGWASEGFDIEVGYRVMRSRLGICTCLQISSADAFERGLAAGRPVGADLYSAEFAIERPKQELWHHLALARTRLALGRAGELHATYAFQYNDRREFDIVRQSVDGPQLDFGLATHSADLRLEHAALRMRQWTLVGSLGTGVTHQNNEFEAATTLIPDYRQWSWNVYDIERFVHERIEFEFGARYDGLQRATNLDQRDYQVLLAGDRLDLTACRAQGEGGYCRQGFHTPSGTIGLLARPIGRAPEFTWRVQLDSSARIPAIDEHFMNGAAPSFPILGFGDSTIGVERGWGGESGLNWDGDWLVVDAAAHVRWIDGYVQFLPQPQEGQCAPLTCTTRGPFPVFAFVPTDAVFAGGEVHFDLVAPRLPLGMSGSGAWVRARDPRSGDFLPFIPADRYTLVGRWFWPDTKVSSRGNLEITGTLVTRQRNANADTDFAPPPPAYVLLGAGVGIEFPTTHEIFRVSVQGTNLLNLRYRDYNSLLRYFADEPGWGVQARLAVEFDAPMRDRA